MDLSSVHYLDALALSPFLLWNWLSDVIFSWMLSSLARVAQKSSSVLYVVDRTQYELKVH